MTTLFYVSLLMWVYAYAGYPVALLVRRIFVPRKQPLRGLTTPPVSIVLPVHNGASILEARLSHLLGLDYATDAIEVIVVSDGSDDGTVDILERQTDTRVVAVVLDRPQGKEVALNAGIERASNDLLVFVDLGVELYPDALSRIVAPFEDERVGVVTGVDESVASSDSSVVRTAGLYTRYEIAIRRLEAATGSLFVVNGCFFAARRHLCLGMSPWVTVDMWVPCRAVREGYCVALEEAARAKVPTTRELAGEFQRRIRTFHRGMTTYFEAMDLANPIRYGWVSIQYLSHKLARWLVPFWMVTCLVSSVVLARESAVASIALVSQVLLYGFGGVGLLVNVPRPLRSIANICGFYLMVNAALVVAWSRVLRGKKVAAWRPTVR